jgi:hypothetical protein
MYKNLSITVLLVAFGLVAARSTGTPTATFTSPVIIKKIILANQTAPIPTTTIFTPASNGLFRVSVYMTTPVVNSNPNNWIFNLEWTDEAGVENTNGSGLLQTSSVSQPPGAWGGLINGGLATPTGLAVIQCNAGHPVTYSVSPSLTSDLGTYSLYFTVERLI